MPDFPWPNEKASRKISLWLAIIFIIVAFGGGLVFGLSGYAKPILNLAVKSAPVQPGAVKNKDAELPAYLSRDVNFNLFWDVWQLVKDNYYDKDIPDTKLFYGAVAGIVAALQDPYSTFMTPVDSADFEKEIEGKFEGIGAEIALKNGQLTIVAPLPDSPAIKAGLRPKDMILKIDALDSAGISLERAVSLIRGKQGTQVVLSVYRDGFNQAKDFKIIRAKITVKSLTWEFRADNIMHIKTRQFNDDTILQLDRAISDLAGRQNIKGVILDLRNNPGGYLQSAINMAGEWVDGQTVVSEKLRDGETIEHKAERVARLAGYKTIVLIDGGSASASEIVAGALQDYGRAVLVGEKTFGKGSVQDMTELSDGSSVKLTIAKWFTPKGRSIQDEGIEPDVKIELAEKDYNEDKDPQLDKAIELLNNQ